MENEKVITGNQNEICNRRLSSLRISTCLLCCYNIAETYKTGKADQTDARNLMNRKYLEILTELELDEGNAADVKFIGSGNPFMVTLVSTSNKTNVDFLYATESIWDQTRYGLPAGVTAGAGYGNVTYKGLLSQLLTHDITIGAFLIESTTNAAATATILLRTDNQKGEAYEDTILPKILPTWKQTGIAYLEKEVKLTAWTKATISNLYTNVAYRICMYPVKMSLNTAYSGVKTYDKEPEFLKLSKKL